VWWSMTLLYTTSHWMNVSHRGSFISQVSVVAFNAASGFATDRLGYINHRCPHNPSLSTRGWLNHFMTYQSPGFLQLTFFESLWLIIRTMLHCIIKHCKKRPKITLAKPQIRASLFQSFFHIYCAYTYT